ncbi:MAG: hypothetical protein GY950_27300, partial [bacterium]|nr:hypothetical protein [bacterium]
MQYEKKFPFYYTKEELDQQLSHGIIITDYFPVIEGKFQLAVVLQNSINKEISYFEKMIDIPNAAAAQPIIFGPLVSYRIDQLSDIVYSSFNIMGNNIKIDPSRTFGLRDSITALFCVDRGAYNKPIRVEVTVASQDESRPYSKTYPLEFPSGKRFWCFTKPLEKLRYSNYEVKAKVMDEKGTPLDVKSRSFQVSPKSYVPHPPMAGKRLRKENQFLFLNMVATQYQKIDNQTRAQDFFEKALKIKPKFAPTIKNYASLLMTQKKYDNVLAVIENLEGQEKEAFSYFSYKGRALFHLKSYNAAVDALLEANKIYDSDVPVLNTLGSALIRTGEKEEALRALSASLTMNKYQKDVEKIVTQLKKEIDNDKNKKNK